MKPNFEIEKMSHLTKSILKVTVRRNNTMSIISTRALPKSLPVVHIQQVRRIYMTITGCFRFARC